MKVTHVKTTGMSGLPPDVTDVLKKVWRFSPLHWNQAQGNGCSFLWSGCALPVLYRQPYFCWVTEDRSTLFCSTGTPQYFNNSHLLQNCYSYNIRFLGCGCAAVSNVHCHGSQNSCDTWQLRGNCIFLWCRTATEMEGMKLVSLTMH